MGKEKTFENFTEHCFSSRLIDRLTAENQRLKEQLDKEIHINRKLVKALKMYADMSNWFVCYLRHHFIFKKDNYKANELAKETLKEVGEE